MPEQTFEACVGESLDDAWFVARRYESKRYESGMGPDGRRMEYWLGRLEAGGAIGELWATRTPLECLVRCPGRATYVLARRGDVSGDTGEDSGVWQLAYEDDAIRVTPVAALGWFMHRLTALDDGSLVAWSFDGVLRCDDGETVRDLPRPPFESLDGLAGADGSRLVAWGDRNRVAVCDGRGWSTPVALPVLFIRAVARVGAAEAYAAGVLPSELYRWDGVQWARQLAAVPPIADLAVFRGELVVAVDDDHGLAHARGGQLEPLPVAAQALHLHAGRDALILIDDDRLADSRDLRETRAVSIADFAALIAQREPLWRGVQLDGSPTPFTGPLPRSGGLAEWAPVRYGFAVCLGRSLDDAVFLASRSEPWDRPSLEERESVVGRVTAGVVTQVTTTRVMLRGLQRVASGRLYVAAWSSRGGVWRTPPDGALVWERLEVPPMQGVFALDDTCVMAWGGVGLDPAQDFTLFDGQAFRPIPSPGARVLGVHGCAPDWIVAVGHDGLLSRWDGQRWHRWTVQTTGTFGSVVVVSPDKMYATGPLGAVYEGSRHGWTERAPTEGASVGIARWRGNVWIGDPVRGLSRLTADRLEVSKLPVRPFNLYPGADALLMAEQDGFAETRDLKSVRRIGARELATAQRDQRPSWR